MDRRRGRQAPTRCSTSSRARARTARFTFPDRRPRRRTPDGVARNQWIVDHDGTLVGDRRPPAPGRPVDRPQAHARRAHRGALPLARALLRAGRRGLVGRLDDRARRRTGGSRSRRATCSPCRAPTTRARRRGTSRWGSCRSAMTDGPGRRRRPVHDATSTVTGVLTHGHLPENDHHGGSARQLPDAAHAPRRPAHADGRHQRLRLRAGRPVVDRRAGRPPVVSRRPAADLRQRRRRAATSSTRSPRAGRPAPATTGIAYPLANGAGDFDSGELGFGPAGFTAGRQPQQWQTPAEPDAGHLHVLLPHPPVHARRLPREGVVPRACSSSSSSPTRRSGCWGTGPRLAARTIDVLHAPVVSAWPDPRDATRVVALGSDRSVHASKDPWIARPGRLPARGARGRRAGARHLLRRPGARRRSRRRP